MSSLQPARTSLVLRVLLDNPDGSPDEVFALIRGLEMPGVRWGDTYTPVRGPYDVPMLDVPAVIEDDKIDSAELALRIEMVGMTPEQAALKRRVYIGADDNEVLDGIPAVVRSAELQHSNKL